MSLSDEIRAKVDEAERIAKAAECKVPGCEGLLCNFAMGEPEATHVEAWQPGTVLRHVAHARDVLGRHRAVEAEGAWFCAGCAPVGGGARFWPCVEVLSLAKAWSVDA